MLVYSSPTPDPNLILTIVPTNAITDERHFLYYSKSGETLPQLASRFNVSPKEIFSPVTLSDTALLVPDTLLVIPNRVRDTGPADAVMPDSEVVYSPSASGFNTHDFVMQAGGYLSTFKEWHTGRYMTGAEIVEQVARDNSVNPRLLLTILEYQSHWVYGNPASQTQKDYPLGYVHPNRKNLFLQLSWGVQQMAIGYYGWRAGIITNIKFQNDDHLRLAPTLNAGSVGVQNLMSKLYDRYQWEATLYGPNSLQALHMRMFGDFWIRSLGVEPLYPPDLKQPELQLPFLPGRIWSLTGGPHSAWGSDGALSALDFAPATSEKGCIVSTEWATAVAAGLVVRSGNGVVVLDLDKDGDESTGWAIVYLHIASQDRVPLGTILAADERIGHPSCEGGIATGTHVHVARKYNGEWILADGPVPFNLGGWIAHKNGEKYGGYLTNGDDTITASLFGSHESQLIRK